MAGETQQAAGLPVLTPRTPAAELANLSLHPAREVRAAVAAHPNTAPFVLSTLAARFPGEVLGNPGLPLLRLANPHLLRDWPAPALHALAAHPEAPVWVRRLAAARPEPELPAAVAQHPNLTPAEIEMLSRHSAWLVRARIAARPDLSRALLETLRGDPDYGVRLAVASRPDLTAADLHALLADPSRLIRQAAHQAKLRPGKPLGNK